MGATDKQRIALITVGSKGIGAAVAEVLARDGLDIWLNFRNDHEAVSVVAAGIIEKRIAA